MRKSKNYKNDKWGLRVLWFSQAMELCNVLSPSYKVHL